MPPDLVAAVRHYSPEATFPAPALQVPESPPTPSPVAASPAPEHSGQRGLEQGSRVEPPELQQQEYEPEVEFLTDPNPLPAVSAVSASAGDLRGEAGPMSWLLAILQEAMTGVMASDIPPLQKANTIARLGSLYLKAYRASDLEQANKALKRRVVELEAMVASSAQRVKDVDRCSPALPGAVGPSEAHAAPAPPRVSSAPWISASLSPPSSRGDEVSQEITRARPPPAGGRRARSGRGAHRRRQG
jgi:hypothetical protein